MNGLQKFLGGRKTYVVGIVMMLHALTGALLGEELNVQELLTGLGLITLRAGVSKGGNGSQVMVCGGTTGGASGTGALPVVAALAVAGAVLCGCATMEQGAYRTLGSASASVDAAMKGWAGYVNAGLATAAEEGQVRKLYGDYQAAMRAARVAVLTWKAAPDTKPQLERALDAVEASAGAVVVFVQRFVGRAEG